MKLKQISSWVSYPEMDNSLHNKLIKSWLLEDGPITKRIKSEEIFKLNLLKDEIADVKDLESNFLGENLQLNHFTSSALISIVVSLGLFKFSKFFAFALLKSAPQFMQIPFFPKDTVPHSLQVFTFEFKELILINAIKNIKIGTKIISNKKLPIKLTKKLNPKTGSTIRSNKE